MWTETERDRAVRRLMSDIGEVAEPKDRRIGKGHAEWRQTEGSVSETAIRA